MVRNFMHWKNIRQGVIVRYAVLVSGAMGTFFSVPAAITPQIVVNRAAGVAPLAVFVDATATAGLSGGDYINANFDWNFDRDGVDPAGKHTVTRGFVAAHVYENPGTYTVQLTVHDRFGATANATTQIVVSAFSGTTYYVASDGSNSAAGTSMVAPLATPDYAMKNKSGPNTRILIRNGDRFTVSGYSVSGSGPVIVGSYSDPNHPSNRAPVLFNNENGWGFISFEKGASDWRIMDILVMAPNNRVFGLGSATNILLLRIEIDSVGKDFTTSGGTNQFVFDCSMRNFGLNGSAGYGMYGDPFNQSAFVGNVSRRQQGGEHLFRTQSGTKMFIAYNEQTECINVMSAIQIRGSSSQVYLLGNRVEKAIGFHPQNSTSSEHESYCVADGNIFINAGLAITARHIGVRNNLFYNGVPSLDVHPLVGESDSVTLLNNSCYGQTDNLVPGSATNVVIKNNILFSTTADNYASGLSSSGFTGYQIDNNLYYAPGRSGGALSFNGNGFSGWQTSGNDVHGKCGVNPLFISTDSSSTDFLKLSAGSPAIGAGAAPGDAAPVFCDFDGVGRVTGQPTDMGALLHTSTGIRPNVGVEKSVASKSRAIATYDILGRRLLPVKGSGPSHQADGIVILRRKGFGDGLKCIILGR